MAFDDRLQFLHDFFDEALVEELGDTADSLHIDAQVNDVIDCLEFGDWMDEPSEFAETVDCVEQKLGKAFFTRQGIQSLSA